MVLNWVSIYSQSYDDEWWDVSWHYRVGLEINNTGYERKDWPIEYEMNFTKILQDVNASGTFDENSTRVIEYNSTGSVLHELPSQFDKGENYDPASNAVGTLVFEMNGTTQADEIRYFYIYFDTTEYGNKNETNYSTDLSYNYSGNVGEFEVNNTFFQWSVDTERAENTSGIYYVKDLYTAGENEILRVNPADNKTVEYSEFSNATDTFGFDFRDNATLKYTGPVRIVVEQKGEEIFWNQPDNKTNEGYLTKRYTFYRDIDWVKIEQIFVNNASYNITRNSTAAGALAVFVNYSFLIVSDSYPNMSNTIDPGSYGWAAADIGNFWMGVVNIYENGTENFFGLEDSPTGRLGIQLNETNITAGSSIKHVAALQFNASGEAGQENYFLAFVNQSITSLNITEFAPEFWTVAVNGTFYMNETDEANIFNRNETVIIRANITDLYNLSERVNASLDLGGTG